ncbi:MAG: choice-of-anchor D domain-containing protein [Archangiaceae bacterium]|nr:choice-of-anchor D domain-containing protein [Archangiaceae bacterium]
MVVVYEDMGTGSIVSNRDGVYDFGKVPMGTHPKLKVTIRNLGDGKLQLETIAKDSGENVKLGDTVNEDSPVFEMAFAPTSVDPSESVEFELTFNAPLEPDTSIKTKDHLAKVVVRANNTAVGEDTSTITFMGTAVSSSCQLPSTIDFGAVAVNDTVKQKFTIANNSLLPATASVGSITSNSGDHLAFDFAPESITGMASIPAGGSRDLVFTFKPSDVHDYLALVKARAAEECPELTIKLVGNGVNQVLSCDSKQMNPGTLDFGFVTPGLTVQKELTLVNQGLAPVSMTNVLAKVGSMPSSEYKVLGADNFMVPGATRMGSTLTPGTVTLQLTFTPSLLGLRNGAFTGNTSLSQQAMLSCPLRGQGGGPDIDVKPAVMNMGKVPYFVSAPKPFSVSRKLTVQNLGTNPTPDDLAAHLYLQRPAGSTDVPWDIIPKNADSLKTDICVGTYDEANNTCLGQLPAAYLPAVGIKAVAGSSLLDIPVRITPHAKDLNMEFDVVIYSNDPDEPMVTVNIKAQSVELPPCNYSVTPTALNFGLVTPPQFRDLSFQIKNLGSNAGDTCLITHLEMKPGSDQIFTLPAGELDQVELQPGGVQNVAVRAWPMGNASATVQQVMGAVSFGISSPTQPLRDVALSASIATACLTITPSDLDFGTVKKNCSSPARVFNIYNTCSAAITVNSYGMLAAAGVPGGSMYCPGTAVCPEFLINGTPSFAAGSMIPPGGTMPVTFALKYKPLDDGPDTGAFQIKVTQNGQVVDYIVTLRGVGDNFGLNTDTFRQDSKPKADILLVIDDSGSMSDKQVALGTNFASFIRYADSAGVDYHIAVVGTELGPPASPTGSSARVGKFIGGPNNNMPTAGVCAGYSGPKVLTPQTPNVQSNFKNLACVGATGGFEGMSCVAVTALTAPYITDPNINGGFLRPDAILAVVAVTDAADQCPAAATIYENQLRNIKGAQHSNLFSYNVIGPFSIQVTGCSWDESSPDVSKHLYLVNAFSGVKDEICTPNWSTTLENLGKVAFGYRTNFFLTAEPDLTGGNVIEVKIDQGDGAGPVKLDPTDPRGAPVWAYDSVSNSVVFQPLFVPSPGDVLTVTYHVACL